MTGLRLGSLHRLGAPLHSESTITVGKLLDRLYDVGCIHAGAPPRTLGMPVRLIIGGVAHPVTDVWIEPNQEGGPAICIGEDPR